MGLTLPDTELSALANHYSLSPAMALGLGAGVYFEYFRRPAPSPTHYVVGLNRNISSVLQHRAILYAVNREQAVREGLRENALNFNLDRAPTNGLLGIELLAETLSEFGRYADWQACVLGFASCITDRNRLYRETYLDFLVECNSILPTFPLAEELSGIVGEWNAFASCLESTTRDARLLESAGRMLRRLALREEHFWGQVLEF